MAGFKTQYQRLNSNEDQDEDLPPQGFHNGSRGGGETEKGRWNHIENLDEFFIRVYEYHQKDGFVCILLTEFFALMQFAFVVLFTSFLVLCVDYDKLFKDKDLSFKKVIHFHKVKHMESAIVVCLVIALIFWLIRLARLVVYFFKLLEIHSFYKNALQISESELINLQWQDVQKKLIEVQKIHQMCVHKEELTELDIHHRILRWKNYFIAMQNKGVIPCTYKFPFIGQRTFLTEGMKYNLKMILFWGPGSPFQDNWKLGNEYKNLSNRSALANRLSRRIFWIGVANILLCPFIFLWIVLYSFFSYAEMIKRAPDALGARGWSPYGRLVFRHFNELDHEFRARLSKSYEPAQKYMNIFTSPVGAIVARNVVFFAGAIFAVLTCLTIFDQDVLSLDHILAVIAGLGLLIRGCYVFIPDENLVWNPEQLMRQILYYTHYIPESWKGKAHTTEVRDQFAQLFQYKLVNVFEELISPIVTPFLLCFSVRYKSLDIVDFYRNFTVEVVGVGDVCSFAQLDVKKHGNPDWMSNGLSEATQYEQGENGKIELSLLHFSIRNPNWKPSERGAHFISTIKENAMQEGLQLQGSLAISEPSSLPEFRSFNSFQGLPYLPAMSLSDPTVGGLNGGITKADTRQHREQMTEALMNSSVLYMHELHSRQAERLSHVSTSGHSIASGSRQDCGYMEQQQQEFVERVGEQEDLQYEHRDGNEAIV
ncbi:autophagy-related protein 9A-like [Actinia tenebrosa]|uniref:Autophagy-related protein 9 n=1 Tax=Actinia tenebrosa TaxID=6105 RepID=A0A6P8IF34_ACTTE|nr:autophagy-related protein 9A-like [Actinia tenebrosa]